MVSFHCPPDVPSAFPTQYLCPVWCQMTFVPPHLLLLPPPPGLGCPPGVSAVPSPSLVGLSYFGAYRSFCCLSHCSCSSLGSCLRPAAPQGDSLHLELTGLRVRVLDRFDTNAARNLKKLEARVKPGLHPTLISRLCTWRCSSLPV